MRYISLFLILFEVLLSLSALGQIQQGYVKTLGRPDKKGEPLSGVFILVQGGHNPVLSNNAGIFSMLMKGKKNGDTYTLHEVKKKGYELNESGVIGQQYAYSDKVPLIVVMVSKAQLQADKRRIENNAYKVAEKNYKEKLELLEKQKETNAITEEQYRIALLDIQNKFEKYQLLIDGLAEHYAHVDYDELDDNEGEVNYCIENGDLERADSLLKTMFEPIGVLKRNKDAIVHFNQQITEANMVIDRAEKDMVAVLKQQEKDANYLYQLYTIALSRFDQDKAREYIETRAELDTTNIRWQVDAASFHRTFSAQYRQAEKFLDRGLSQSYKQYNGWNMISAYILNDLARTYEKMGKMKNADDCYRDAFTIFTHNNDTICREAAMLFNNHGVFLMKNGIYDEAVQSLERAKEIKVLLYGENHIQLANVYNNLGMLYYYLRQNTEALDYYQKALPLFLKHYGEKNVKVSNCYNNIGMSYFAMNDTANAKFYISKGLNIRLSLYGVNGLPIAESYNNLGSLYLKRGELSVALGYHKQALAIRVKMLGHQHTDVAQSLVHIGEIQDVSMDFKCVETYYHALLIYLQSSIPKNSNVIQPLVTRFYNSYCTSVQNALTTIPLDEFLKIMDNYVILLTIEDDDTPASRLGMKGQYILLEFGQWTMGSANSIFAENNKLRGKSKDILVYDDSGINSFHFDGNLGAKMELYFIGKEQKQKFIEKYNKWKVEHLR